jgi:hypothetical protein
VVERAVKAAHGSGIDAGVAVADMLAVIDREGLGKAKVRVRVLEETLAPGTVRDLAARQRARSFLRVGETEDGMVRIDALLDAARGAVVRSVLDQMVAGGLHSRQYDKVERLPGDVVTVEQMGAQALTRLAEVYLTASPERRAEPYRPRTLFITRMPGSARNSTADENTPGLSEIPEGCARTVYGQLVPVEGLPSVRDSAASVLTVDPVSGEPVALDGRDLDAGPGARLASPDQRTALGFRDRECTEPGCSRPVTWSLHAHHQIAFKDGGETRMGNLTSLCSEHQHPAPPPRPPARRVGPQAGAGLGSRRDTTHRPECAWRTTGGRTTQSPVGAQRVGAGVDRDGRGGKSQRSAARTRSASNVGRGQS